MTDNKEEASDEGFRYRIYGHCCTNNYKEQERKKEMKTESMNERENNKRMNEQGKEVEREDGRKGEQKERKVSWHADKVMFIQWSSFKRDGVLTWY